MAKVDVLVVTSLDRLGRNNRELKELIQTLKAKGANIEILYLPSLSGDNDLTFRDLLINLVIKVHSYIPGSERKNKRAAIVKFYI